MKNTMVLLGKELREILLTSRIYVLPGLFLFFGRTSPILTKMMPEILKSIGAGITIVIPPPEAKDSFLQLLKNLSQIGLLAVILSNMGIVAEEKTSGTALLVLTKPASRHGFVLAKFAAQAVLVVAATALGYAVSLAYTVVLFENTPVAASMQAVSLFGVYALFILAVTVAASAASRTSLAAGGLSVLGFFVFSLLSSLGGVFAKWSPGALLSYAGNILEGRATAVSAAGAGLVAVVCAAVLLAAGMWAFSRQEL